MWAGVVLNTNYEAEGVKGIVHACNLDNGFVTGFRWFHGERKKVPFRMKLENFVTRYQISIEQ